MLASPADGGVKSESASLPTLRVELPGPMDLPASLDYLRRYGDDRLDRWDGTTLVRVLPVAGQWRPAVMTVGGDLTAPLLSAVIGLEPGETLHPTALKSSVAAQFVSEHEALGDLAARDEVIAEVKRRNPGISVLLQPHLLHALVRSISAQQVNLAWATTTRARLVELVGTRFPVGAHAAYALDADRLAGTPVGDLRALQFTTSKAEYLVTVAEAVADGTLMMDKLQGMDDDGVIARLTSLRGIGRWSAEWFLARSLGRPRVVAGDLGVRRAVGLAYGRPVLPSEAETRALTAHWGRAATVAQQLVLESFTGCR